MKKLIFVVAAVFAAVAYADRTDVWLSSSVDVYKVELSKLPDGGCAVSACALVTKQSGGTVSECSNLTEVSGANRTTCLDILDTKAPALFKQDKGL